MALQKIAIVEDATGRMAVFDIVKFVLSIMIVAIHSELYPLVLYPWLRIAVPFFFIISSFFFFKKVKKFGYDNKVLYGYVKRNCLLYLFYFILLLPYTLYIRKYFANGFFRGICTIIRALFFSSTWQASWFIQAIVIGTIIIFFCSKKINYNILFIVSCLFYTFTSIYSSYIPLLSNCKIIVDFFRVYVKILGEPVCNAPAALFWIVVGKGFAEERFKIKKNIGLLLTVTSLICLYIEWFIIKEITDRFNRDAYIFLMPTCLFLFSIIKDIKIKGNKITEFLGKSSVVTYATHYMLIGVISFLYSKIFNLKSVPVLFFTTVVLCLLACAVIFKLEKYKPFKWLKYLH